MKTESKTSHPRGQRAFNIVCAGLLAAVALGIVRAEVFHGSSDNLSPFVADQIDKAH